MFHVLAFCSMTFWIRLGDSQLFREI
jgi:hypothetical protein